MSEKLRRMRVGAAATHGMRHPACRKPFGPRFRLRHMPHPGGGETHQDSGAGPKYDGHMPPKITGRPRAFLPGRRPRSGAGAGRARGGPPPAPGAVPATGPVQRGVRP